MLLTCAVDRELSWWTPRAGVDLLVSGVGPVEAACAVSAALARTRYDLVVDAGIAGALGGAAAVGDGVIVVDDRIELSLEDGRPLALPAGSTIVDGAVSDDVLISAIAARGFAVLRGVTVCRVTSTEATAERLIAGGAQVETMEGFAVLRACALAAVPAVQLRGISNRVGDRERSGWDFQAGLDGLAGVATVLFDHIAAEDAAT